MEQTTENQVLIFRPSLFVRVLLSLIMSVGAIALLGLALWQFSLLGIHLLAGIGLAGIAVFCGFLAVYLFKSRIEIWPTEIRYVGVGIFKTKVLPLDAIEGFRILPTQYVKTLVLVPKNRPFKKMSISLSLERQAELLAWMEQNLTNLDKAEYEKELVEIYQNNELGASPEEKAASYKQAQKWCKLVNGAATGVGLWAMFFPQPYNAAIWTLVVVPFAGLLCLRRFDGIARYNAKKGGAYPSVDAAFLMPALGLALRALFDWHLLEWENFWVVFAAISTGLVIVSICIARDIRRTATAIFLCCLYSTIYGAGATIALNGMLADSKFTRYHAKVMGKHVSSGKTTTYYLTLSPWRNRTGNEDVTVSRSTYSEYKEGDTAEILVRTGKFGIPYYIVR